MRAIALLSFLSLSASRRNVLFLLEDDGGLAMGPYGDHVIDTPSLDALSACGATFDNAYTSVSSCSPSRASILTGMPTHQNGQYGLAQDPEHFAAFSGIQSLPNILTAAGVATGIQGKYHIWTSGSMASGLSGFNFTWGGSLTGPGGCQAGASNACPQVNYNLVSRNITYMRNQMQSFLDWAADAPFFYYVGFGDSHRCGGAPGEFCELYGLDSNGRSTIPDWTPHVYDPQKVALPWWIQDTPVARSDYAKMYTAKNRMDQGIALMMNALQASGRANETMVIYFADNGAPFAAGKTNFYQPGAIEPLIISLPGGPAGMRTDVLASALDLMPTILDWMGVIFVPYQLNGQTVNLQGKSLLPLLLSQETPSRSSETGSCFAQKVNVKQPVAAPHPLAMTAEQHAHSAQSTAATSLKRSMPSNYSSVHGSFQHHEIQEYYPMRYVIAQAPSDPSNTTQPFMVKLIYNIASGLPYPIASDLWAAPAMQDLINRTAAGVPTYWYRNFTDYLGTRNRWELYDLVADSAELDNRAADPNFGAVLTALQADIKAWQTATNDDWLVKYVHE